jgi:hypothetical protein
MGGHPDTPRPRRSGGPVRGATSLRTTG